MSIFSAGFSAFLRRTQKLSQMLWEDIFSLGYLLVLVFPNFFVCETRGCGDCCSNTTYKSINEPRRSTKAVWKAGEKPLCDRGLLLGWYRFTSYTGGKIPEWKVPEDHCGTQAPVWLNGKHPEIKGENVVREACIHVLGDGCWERFDINITNCGDYFVYYLRPFYYCAVAYCAGENCHKYWLVNCFP